MLHQDAPDLFNHGGICHADVRTMYEKFRGNAVDMRARIGNDPVGAACPGRVGKISNDRMRADRRVNSRFAEPQEKRMPRGKLAGARGKPVARPVIDYVVMRQKRFLGTAKPAGAPAELCTQLAKAA